MVVEATQRVLRRTIDEDDQERLISDALESLDSETAGSTSGNGR
jgi:hypothetical protein